LFSDRVVLASKHNDDKYIWESEGDNFTIRKSESGDNLIFETKVTLSERRSWRISRREENR
jgi:HSP90 family molecular chaperone